MRSRPRFTFYLEIVKPPAVFACGRYSRCSRRCRLRADDALLLPPPMDCLHWRCGLSITLPSSWTLRQWSLGCDPVQSRGACRSRRFVGGPPETWKSFIDFRCTVFFSAILSDFFAIVRVQLQHCCLEENLRGWLRKQNFFQTTSGWLKCKRFQWSKQIRENCKQTTFISRGDGNKCSGWCLMSEEEIFDWWLEYSLKCECDIFPSKRNVKNWKENQ